MPLAPWAQWALAIILGTFLVAGFVALVFALVGRSIDPRWRGVHEGPVARDFHEATGDIPIVTAPELAPEPYDLAAALDIDAGIARLDLIEVELERIEWDGFVHDHDLDDFFARVDEVEAAARAYRDALLAHLIGSSSMIGTVYRVTLACDSCGVKLNDGEIFESSATARGHAFVAGWRFIPKRTASGKESARDPNDVCPMCLPTFEAKPDMNRRAS